jgi:hypothetical protein
MIIRALAACLMLLIVLPALPLCAQEEVVAVDSGAKIAASTYECPGHQIETHLIALQSATAHYQFRYSGCTDPSHNGERPSSEGNFGMPEPNACNWYWGGFFRVAINGTEAQKWQVKDMRVTESGARAGFQIIWLHPDAEVGLRLLLPPRSNHVVALLTWKPLEGKKIESGRVSLTCYPGWFTDTRKGERHVKTALQDGKEPQVVEVDPAKDTYLFYYDAVFDAAKGEGNGPCAAVVAPEGVSAARVRLTNYPVVTEIDLQPEADEARLCFYDFAKQTNAEAEAYLVANGARDLAELQATDFRPEVVRALQFEQLKAEATGLVNDAAEDGKALKPKVEALLAQVEGLAAQAQAGDWQAEAELAQVLRDSADLFWKLRAFAVLNRAE